MSYRMPLLPRLESLETQDGHVGWSIGRTGRGRGHGPGTRCGAASHFVRRQRDRFGGGHGPKVELDGQAKGFYTSRQDPPDTGTRFRVNAIGC